MPGLRKVSELWRASRAARADRHTMDTCAVPSPILMERAALCVSREVATMLAGDPALRRVFVLCGPGNNGGDGMAMARQLHGWGVDVCVYLATERRNETAAAQLKLCEVYGVRVAQTLPEPCGPEVVVVDALLGTGAQGAPRGGVAAALVWAQQCRGPIVAVDIPSGVHPDTGYVYEHAIKAQATVTFKRSKPGLHVTPGRDHSGRVTVAAIGLIDPGPGPEDALPCRLIDPHEVAALLCRPAAAHKGQRGHVGVVGGSPGTPGAAVLAGAAALRGGAGLVTICSHDPGVARQLLAARPELMTVHEPLEPGLLAATGALVVGPGLTDAGAREALDRLYREDPRPAIWDASALDHVPAGVDRPRVVTPHPGEAARMLTRLTGESWNNMRVQENRLEAARRLAQQTRAVVVLKGAGTVVACDDCTWICIAGGPALATAGSGDCLAGLIGALLARGLKPQEAARAGVHIHALAGEIAATARAGAVAMDIADCLGQAMTHPAEHPRWPQLRQG